MGVDVGQVQGRLVLFDDFTRVLEKAEASLTSSATKMKKVGEDMTKIGVGLAPLSAGAAVLAGAGIKAFADFDAALTESTAIMSDVTDDLRKKMSDTAREVAKTSSFSATQAAESYYFLASAGLDAAQSIAALPQVTKFAQAGAFEMARATDLLTDAQSALGMTIRDDAIKNMENMVKVGDALVKANVLANASVEQFSIALTNKAANAMRDLNIELHDGLAVLAAWADQGVKAEAAGERFNIVTRDLQRAARDNADEFERYGIAVFNQQGNFRKISDIIRDMTVALAGMSDQQKGAALAALGFQDRSIAATRSLLGMADVIDMYASKIQAAGGTMADVADKQMQTFWKQMGLLWARIVDVAIGIGERLVPHLMSFQQTADRVVTVVERLGNAFANMPPWVQQATIAILGLTAIASPALVGLGLTIKAIGFAFQGLGGLAGGAAKGMTAMTVGARNAATAMLALRGAMAGIIGLGIGAAIAIIGNEIDRFRGKLKAMDEDIAKIQRARDIIKDTVSGVEEAEGILKAFEAGKIGAQLEAEGPITLKMAEAYRIARQQAEGLAGAGAGVRISLEQAQQGLSGVAADGGRAAQASDYLTARLAVMNQQLASLTSEQRANIIAGEKMGMSVEQITESMKALWPTIKLTSNSVQVFLDRAKAAADKLADFRREVREFSKASEANKDVSIISDKWVTLAGTYQQELQATISLTNKLTAEQRRSIDAGVRLGHSVEQVSHNLNISQSVIARYTDAMKAFWQESAKLGAENVDLTKTFHKLETQAGSYEQLLDATRREVAGLTEAQRRNIESGLAMGRTLEEISKELGVSVDALRMLQRQSGVLDTLAKGFAQLGQITGGRTGGILTGIGKIVSGLSTANEVTKKTGGNFGVLSAAFSDASSKSEKFAAVLASVGAVAQGVQDILAATANTTNRMAGAMQGALAGAGAGSAFGPIGTAIGAVGGALFGFLRAGSNARKAAEALRKEVEKVRNEFAAAYPEIANVNEVARILGITFTNVTEQWHLELLKEQMEQFGEQLEKVRDEAAGLLGEAKALGIGLPQALQESILKMIDLGIITGDTAALFHSMLNDGESDWRKMKEAADRYGITVDQLGEKFQQQMTNASYESLINDYEILKKGGADVGAVINGMAEQINGVVAQSLKFGTTVPENMREMIESLLNSGQLTDEFGEKMTDLSRIKWGAPIESQFDRLIRKIEEMIDRLGDLAGGFAGVTRAADGVQAPGARNPGFTPEPTTASRAASAADYASAYASAPGVALTGDQHVTVNVDGRKFIDFVIKGMGARANLMGVRG